MRSKFFGSGIDQHHPIDLPAMVVVLHVYATWGWGALELWFLLIFDDFHLCSCVWPVAIILDCAGL